jgi:uracil-DNA glycosylase
MPENNEFTELIADVRERILFMQEIGVTDMNVDLTKLDAVVSGVPAIQAAVPTETARDLRATPPPPIPLQTETPKAKPARTAGSRLASLPSLKDLTPNIPGVAKPPTKIEIVPERADIVETIPEIRAEIGPDCVRCKLSQLGRSKVVNSVGNFDADLMFVGEAPGADEDEQGEPFVGRAGKLLTDIMNAIGFQREDVFIGNINRCRPPKNRAPEPDESSVCKPFLEREIAVVRPKVIVVLGATAAQNLLETKVPIGKLRGHFHDYRGTKVMPTFHPAYLLRDPHKKRDVWEDMKKVREYLQTN